MFKNAKQRNQFLGMSGFFILLVLSFLLYTVWASMPVVRGNITHSRILDKVEVTRDQKGIPRIIGHRSRDVYFAQGYVHAQDRIFQMVLMKHMFLGRMSEIFGDRMVSLDKYMRYFNVGSAAQASFDHFGQSFRMDLEAYADGVNAYINENRKTIEARLLGYDITPWRPEDSIVIQKAIAFDMSKHWPRIMRNTTLAAEYGLEILDQYYPQEEVVEPSVLDEDLIKQRLPYDVTPKVYPDGPEIPEGVVASFSSFAKLNDQILTGMATDETLAPGSNAWAVAPERNASGQPVMASDPHLTYNVPNTFYLVHLRADQMSLTGASIPGSPGIIIGRNSKISWGFTNSRLDQADIFYAKDIPGKVERNEVISVKGGDDVSVTYYDSEFGVLISSPGAEYEVALSWTGMAQEDPTLEAISHFSNASSIQEARRFTKNFQTPSQNLVMIDDQGNYGLYVLGNIPMRKHSGRVAVPATYEYQWKKPIPHWEMPYVENPKRGYVMNANSRVVSPHYGHNLTKLGFDDLRAIRLAKLLKEDKIFTVEDHQRIQLDNEDQQWLIMRDVLLDTKPSSPLAKDALLALSQWDSQAVKDSFEVTIISAWQREMSSQLYSAISASLPKWAKPVHNDFYVRQTIQENRSECHFDGGECDEFLTQTLERAVTKLAKQYGTEDITQWKWQHAHKALFRHGLFKKVPVMKHISERQISVNGTRDSLNRSRWFSGSDRFMGTQGACLRMVVDMSDYTGLFSIPMGESGNIFSKHYDDLLEGWANGEYMTLPKTQARGHEAQLLFFSES
ncbi:MAG: penicillin acylase family protein [Pseudomonadota bacterium]|nr:penicillin acylase family protein [Pseudomonadota bacterium]